MKTKYDFAMVVGRFQPYQNAHHKLLNHALSLGKKVIVVLGSSHSRQSPKNPFTAAMREEMIRASFDSETQSRLIFTNVRDYFYNNNLWLTEVQNIANQIIDDSKATMALVGHFKDKTSFYLNQFPQWKLEHFEAHIHNKKVLNATDVRELYFYTGIVNHIPKDRKWDAIKELVPEAVYEYLKEFSTTEKFKYLVNEHLYNTNYPEEAKKHPIILHTTDTLVTALGHVLLVKRGHQPGRGLLALPGGFVEQGLWLKENALKELREETGIKVPKQILESNIVNQDVFDYPYRSERGRTITYAFHIELNPNLEDGLPRVKGGDDAEKAFWLPIADVRMKEDEFFEDHFSIIQKFLGF